MKHLKRKLFTAISTTSRILWKLTPLTFDDFVELSTSVALSFAKDVSTRSTATLALDTLYVAHSKKAAATMNLDKRHVALKDQ